MNGWKSQTKGTPGVWNALGIILILKMAILEGVQGEAFPASSPQS
jgi:hypothetical protein